MRERLLGRQLERGKLGRGGARGEGTAPSGLACRDGGVAERQRSSVAQRAGEHSNAARGQRSGRGACWRGRAASSNGAAARRGDDGGEPWRAGAASSIRARAHLRGGDGAARRQQGGSRAASGGRQRLSAAAGARAACLDACARSEGESARERERREEKGVKREKRKSTV